MAQYYCPNELAYHYCQSYLQLVVVKERVSLPPAECMSVCVCVILLNSLVFRNSILKYVVLQLYEGPRCIQNQHWLFPVAFGRALRARFQRSKWLYPPSM
jgi:hypothetical protein